MCDVDAVVTLPPHDARGTGKQQFSVRVTAFGTFNGLPLVQTEGLQPQYNQASVIDLAIAHIKHLREQALVGTNPQRVSSAGECSGALPEWEKTVSSSNSLAGGH